MSSPPSLPTLARTFVPLSEKKTASSAGVQNPTAFWEIWFNTEGQELSLGHETVLIKVIESLFTKSGVCVITVKKSTRDAIRPFTDYFIASFRSLTSHS